MIERVEVASLPEQDLVWVDAPCSGTGIMRRHPDVRWLRKEAELNALRSVQEALLAEAWEKVRPGGFLAYSVCSVLKDEGPQRLQALVKKCAARGSEPIWVRDWLLTPMELPHGDGFWAGLLRKPFKVGAN